jgi:acyl carrier protein
MTTTSQTESLTELDFAIISIEKQKLSWRHDKTPYTRLLNSDRGSLAKYNTFLCLAKYRLATSTFTMRNNGMEGLSPFELEVAQLLIDTLNLEDMNAADIDPEAHLFGEGLGLDSIDALELALAISNKYGFQLRSDDAENTRIFASLRALSQHIEKNRTKLSDVS